MFKDIKELAENKLIILYIINALNGSISRSDLSQIVLENNLMNYFSLQQYLSELIDIEFIIDKEVDNKHILTLSENGKEAYAFFKNRINEKRKNLIDSYLEIQIPKIIEDFKASSSYSSSKSGNYIVNLVMKNPLKNIIDINLSVSTEKEAKSFCEHWNENYKNIYGNIISLLDKNKTV